MKKQSQQEEKTIPIVLPGQLNMFAELDAFTERSTANAEIEVRATQAYMRLEFDFKEYQLELFPTSNANT